MGRVIPMLSSNSGCYCQGVYCVYYTYILCRTGELGRVPGASVWEGGNWGNVLSLSGALGVSQAHCRAGGLPTALLLCVFPFPSSRLSSSCLFRQRTFVRSYDRNTVNKTHTVILSIFLFVHLPLYFRALKSPILCRSTPRSFPLQSTGLESVDKIAALEDLLLTLIGISVARLQASKVLCKCYFGKQRLKACLRVAGPCLPMQEGRQL